MGKLYLPTLLKNGILRTSLVVPGLRLCASNSGGVRSLPDWRTKIPHAIRSKQNPKLRTVNHRNLSSHSPGGQKSKTQVSAGPGSLSGLPGTIVVHLSQLLLAAGDPWCWLVCRDTVTDVPPALHQLLFSVFSP